MARTWKADAIARGREDGDNAAGWWIQENGGGRDTRPAKDLASMAERILRGMDDCNPEVVDALPAPDLSGQWADSMSGPDLVESVTGVPRSEWTDRIESAFSDLCDAYENAFRNAADRAIVRHLRTLR